MHLSGLLRLLARLLFFAFLLAAVPATALNLLYSEPFEVWRQARAEHLLSEATGLKATISGPIEIGSGLEPTVSIAGISAVEADVPSDVKSLSAKSLSLRVPLLPLLTGHLQLNSIEVEGLKVAIVIPPDDNHDNAEDDVDAGAGLSDFVRSRFADDLTLRDAELDYVNQDSGFTLRYEFDEILNRRSGDEILVTGTGRLNGEPWKLDGKIEPPGVDDNVRKLAFSIAHAGLKTALVGTYTFDSPSDTLDVTIDANAPALKRFLAVYEISGDLEGTGDLKARLTGPVDGPKLTDLAFKLAFETGDVLEMTGDIGDVVAGTGIALSLTGSLARAPLAAGKEKPLYDLGITGFSGRIDGSLDGGVSVRDFHVITSSVTAQLHDIGPITAERLYKDRDGRLGLYDVLVLAGDPARPSVHIAGTVTDVLAFQGVDLKGEIDFLAADFLDLAAEDQAEELGHLKGSVAISDADGSLGIEALTATVADSPLLTLSIDLVFDDLPEADELKFDTHLDIPHFKPFAAALGSDVEQVGAFKFDGTITGSDEKITASGTTLIGETTLKGSLTGALSDGRPVLSGDISTALLHLSDLLTLSSINAVYQENVDEKDADVFDYSKVWKTLFVDLQIKVAKIAGGGDGASNIQGRVTYLAGVVGLDPVTLTFLGGKVSANGKIDTTGVENTFALKGGVNNLRIGAVLREMHVSYPVSGVLHVSYDLSGAGNTKAQIPKSLNGNLSMSLRNGWIGTSLLDLAGMSLPAWLLTRVPGGNQADLVCAVAPFTFNKGRASTHGLVLETRNVQVVGVGFINFRRSEVNLRFKPQALRKQFIKIAQPFAITGKLSSPKLVLTGAPVAGAVAGVLAFPFNLLDTIVQPKAEQPGRAPCRVVHTAKGGSRGGTPAAKQRPGGGGPLGLGILGGKRR